MTLRQAFLKTPGLGVEFLSIIFVSKLFTLFDLFSVTQVTLPGKVAGTQPRGGESDGSARRAASSQECPFPFPSFPCCRFCPSAACL